MNGVNFITRHIVPLIGKVRWIGFKPDSLGSVVSMTMKLEKHIQDRNSLKLKEYLAICMKHWTPDNCPVDTGLIGRAIDVIRQEERDLPEEED